MRCVVVAGEDARFAEFEYIYPNEETARVQAHDLARSGRPARVYKLVEISYYKPRITVEILPAEIPALPSVLDKKGAVGF